MKIIVGLCDIFYCVMHRLKKLSNCKKAVCIINFITCLNNFFTPLYYSNNIQVLSVSIVQLPLRDNMYGVPWDLVSAMGWIILLPIIIFVAVFEKQIMDGIMAGGVKA